MQQNRQQTVDGQYRAIEIHLSEHDGVVQAVMRYRSDALSTLAAIARSCEDPRLGMDAGERLTVTRVSGHLAPLA